MGKAKEALWLHLHNVVKQTSLSCGGRIQNRLAAVESGLERKPGEIFWIIA